MVEAEVALMSDNTSAVAYLKNQGGGGGDKIVSLNDLATDIMSVGRDERND